MKTIQKILIKQTLVTLGFGTSAFVMLFMGTNTGITVGLFIGLIYGFFVYFNKAYDTLERMRNDVPRTIHD